MYDKQEKLNKNMQKVVSAFIERESNKQSLITVTRCNLSKDRKNLQVLITVFPESEEEKALKFLERKKWEVRDYLKRKIRTRVLPFIQFAIDKGEKNRQRIDQVLKEV